MKKTSLIIGGIFFAGAGLFFGFSQFLLWERWAVLNEPIRVEKGFSLTTHFTVDVVTTYEVEVRYDKTTDSQPPARDTDERRAQATAFSASVDQSPLALDERITINGNVYYSQGKPSCYIGKFKGIRGHTHRLDLRVNRDLPELAAMHPAVRVRTHSAYIADRRNTSEIFVSLGFAFCLPGAVCLLVYLLSSRKNNTGNGHTAEHAAL